MFQLTQISPLTQRILRKLLGLAVASKLLEPLVGGEDTADVDKEAFGGLNPIQGLNGGEAAADEVRRNLESLGFKVHDYARIVDDIEKSLKRGESLAQAKERAFLLAREVAKNVRRSEAPKTRDLDLPPMYMGLDGDEPTPTPTEPSIPLDIDHHTRDTDGSETVSLGDRAKRLFGLGDDMQGPASPARPADDLGFIPMPPEIAEARRRLLADFPETVELLADLDAHRAGRAPAAPRPPG